MRPGLGFEAAAASSDVSSHDSSAPLASLGRLRPVGRGHHARAKLSHDLFPDLRVLTHLRDVDQVETQPRGLEPFVVAGDAVPIQQLTVVRRGRQPRLGACEGLQAQGAHHHEPTGESHTWPCHTCLVEIYGTLTSFSLLAMAWQVKIFSGRNSMFFKELHVETRA